MGKNFPGIDESILEQKLEFVFSGERMLELLSSNGVTIKNFVFFKHPTPCKEKMESRRRKTEVQETEEMVSNSVSNPYKTAEKTKDKTKTVVDNSSDSDVTPKKAPKHELTRKDMK